MSKVLLAVAKNSVGDDGHTTFTFTNRAEADEEMHYRRLRVELRHRAPVTWPLPNHGDSVTVSMALITEC
ncbi:hypothetical protein NHJ13051_002659 [Beauveria bassiana]